MDARGISQLAYRIEIRRLNAEALQFRRGGRTPHGAAAITPAAGIGQFS